MIDDTRLSHSVFGTPGAERLVVLVGTGIAVTADPLPAETAARNVCVLAVAIGRDALEDTGTFGSETPAEQTAAALADLIRDSLAATPRESDPGKAQTAAIVGYRDGADVALRAAVELGDTIDRLALVAVAAPAEPLDRDDLGALIEGVTAKTLIMNGRQDKTAAAAAAGWYKDHLVSARVEMVPAESALSLSAVWGRVLSHAAPGTMR